MGIKIKKIIKKIRLKRTTVLVIVFIFLSSVLVRQLFSLQIIQGEDYISKFQTRTTKTRVIIFMTVTAQLSPPMYLHILSHSKIAVHTTAPEKRI